MSEFDRKYRAAFGDRSWYDEMAVQWEDRGHDDDCLRTVIESALNDLARAEGVLVANDYCWRCRCDLPESHANTRQDGSDRLCFTCAEIEEERREREQLGLIDDVLRWYRLTPDERERERAQSQMVIRYMFQGLVSRDVQ